jgi:hypothetical protein
VRGSAPDTTNGTFSIHHTTLAQFATVMSDLTGLFWKQLEWIQPEPFIADSAAFLTFVSRNELIFVAACNALKGLGAWVSGAGDV